MRLYEFQQNIILDEGLIDKLPANLSAAIKKVPSDVINNLPDKFKKTLMVALMSIAGIAGAQQMTPEQQIQLAKTMITIPTLKASGEVMLKQAEAALAAKASNASNYQRDIKIAYDEYNKYLQNTKISRTMGGIMSGGAGNPDVARQNEQQWLRNDQQAYDQTIGRVKATYGIIDNSRPGTNKNDLQQSNVKSSADMLFNGRSEVEVEIDDSTYNSGIILPNREKLKLKSAEKGIGNTADGTPFDIVFADNSKISVYIKRSTNSGYFIITK